MATNFFLIFAVTIAITWVVLFIHPFESPKIGGFRMHHYMYGAAGVVVGLLLHSLVVFAVGLGLFIDELTSCVLLGGAPSHQKNYSKASLFGLLLFFVAVVFFFRNLLVKPFII